MRVSVTSNLTACVRSGFDRIRIDVCSVADDKKCGDRIVVLQNLNNAFGSAGGTVIVCKCNSFFAAVNSSLNSATAVNIVDIASAFYQACEHTAAYTAEEVLVITDSVDALQHGSALFTEKVLIAANSSPAFGHNTCRSAEVVSPVVNSSPAPGHSACRSAEVVFGCPVVEVEQSVMPENTYCAFVDFQDAVFAGVGRQFNLVRDDSMKRAYDQVCYVSSMRFGQIVVDAKCISLVTNA